MEQALTSIIVAIFIIFLFIPTVYLRTTNSNNDNIKNNLHFATMALADSIEITDINFDDLSYGYARYMENFDVESANIKIDEPKLLVEFNNVLFKNCQDANLYAKTQFNIVAKILIYNNRFVITGGGPVEEYDYKKEIDKYKTGDAGQFNPSYYFTYQASDGHYYFLNTKNDNVFYYDASGNKVESTVDAIGLTRKQKNEAIINKINRVISDYTNGLIVNFPNPEDKAEVLGNLAKRDINFFEGVTFMVIYKRADLLNVSSRPMEFKNYVVAGYTLK